MINLIAPLFLQEPDASYLNVKDLTDYSVGAYPNYNLPSYQKGLRLIVFYNGTTLSVDNYYKTIGNVTTLSGFSTQYSNANTGITPANNRVSVFSLPMNKAGEYYVSIISIPYLNTNGANPPFTTNFKCGEYGAVVIAETYYIYKALVDYPLSTPFPALDTQQWQFQTFSDSSISNLQAFLTAMNTAGFLTSTVNVQAAIETNYFDAKADIVIDGSDLNNVTITVTDDSTYSNNPNSTFGINQFQWLTQVKVTSNLSNFPEEIQTGIPVSFNFVLSNVLSGLYYFEYINIPNVIVGGQTYQVGDTIYNPFDNLIYQFDSIATVNSQSDITSNATVITDYEDISEQFRKVYVIPVLCAEMSYFQNDLQNAFCGVCGSSDFCKCAGGRTVAAVSVLTNNLLISDEAYKQTVNYLNDFTSAQNTLKTLGLACQSNLPQPPVSGLNPAPCGCNNGFSI